MALDVEADASALDQLRVASRPHRLSDIWICLAFQEQLGDAALQRLDLGMTGRIGLARGRRQLGDVPLYSLGKLDLDLRSGVAAHGP